MGGAEWLLASKRDLIRCHESRAPQFPWQAESCQTRLVKFVASNRVIQVGDAAMPVRFVRPKQTRIAQAANLNSVSGEAGRHVGSTSLSK